VIVMESPFRILAGLPGPVRLLVTGTLINRMGSFIVPFLTLVLLREFHLSEARAATLFAAYGAGSICSILVGGALTDRLGRRTTLMLSLFGSGTLALAMGVVTSVQVFVPLLLVFGFVADLYRPAASAVVGDLLSSRDRPVGFSALRMAVNLGFCTGMAVGGFIADWNWRFLFLGDGLTTLIFGLVVLFFIPETRPDPASTARPGGESEGGAEVPWRDRVFLQIGLAGFLTSIIFFSDLTIMPITITVSAGYPAAVYGGLVALNGFLIAAFEMSAVKALGRFRRLRVAAIGSVFLGVGFGLVGLWLRWPWFLLAILLSTTGEILTSPQQIAFAADWAPARARGRYLGFYQATWSLALAVNPLLLLPLHARLGEAAFWGLLSVMAVPPALLLLHLDRHADRPERLRGLAEAPRDPEILAAIAPEG
jgi:MFS family permease